MHTRRICPHVATTCSILLVHWEFARLFLSPALLHMYMLLMAWNCLHCKGHILAALCQLVSFKEVGDDICLGHCCRTAISEVRTVSVLGYFISQSCRTQWLELGFSLWSLLQEMKARKKGRLQINICPFTEKAPTRPVVN